MSAARNVPIQFGCPRVEKILIVGWNCAVQHPTLSEPRKIRQVGSAPKCEGRPQRVTARPDNKEMMSSEYEIGAWFWVWLLVWSWVWVRLVAKA